MLELTEAQRRALDAATEEAPARATDAETGETVVLLDSGEFDRLREMLGDEPDAPRASDPRTEALFALVPLARYERYKALFKEDPITPGEQLQLLRDFGKRGGWGDPAMDVYDEVYGDKP